MLDPLTNARERLHRQLDALALNDGDVAVALLRIGYPEPRIRDPGFATLLRIIVGQQLSTRSAAALWRKLEAMAGAEINPACFVVLDDAALRACGFSARKMEYGRALAAAVAGGSLSLEALATMDEEAAVVALCALRGFGRWSAEVYLLFALGRDDVFPAGDLALQIAWQRLKRLDKRPDERRLRELAAAWAPFRGAGAVFLWHYYGAATLDEPPAAGPAS